MKTKSRQPSLILASRSPRRQLLLKQIGFRFVVRPSSVVERFFPHESPAHNVRRLALEKARDVAGRTKQGIVVGADTIVVLGKRVLGKPKSKQEARKMLASLSRKWHSVFTGLALVDAASGRSMSDVVNTKVRFREITKDEVAAYVASGSPLDKAGAYGIQDDYGAVFVEEVRGCFYNVVGFPLSRFLVSFSAFAGEPIDQLVDH
ncbi:MAG TPA: Maf family protein [Bacteroidota bacterium]|nr:Maf family protein [Bacteroidota bacterium]